VDIANQSNWYVNEVDIAGQSSWSRSKSKCIPLGRQTFASWNVEGLGAKYYKLDHVIYHMAQRNISILCMQETQCKGLHEFRRNGYMVLLSGCSEEVVGRANAGVGFVIAPSAIRSVIGYTFLNDRLAILRVRVNGGNLNIINGYAPHNGKPHTFQERQTFFY